MLFSRDYRVLTRDEEQKLKKAKSFINAFTHPIKMTIWSDYHELLPDCYYNYNSLFPNNYLHSGYDRSNETLDKSLVELKTIINNNNINERTILNFINLNQYYFIIDSLFWYYDFGHHDAYLFKEFELPPNYIVDYLLVGKSSSGYEFAFIELEHPNKEITLSDGSLGKAFRKGLKQMEDWDEWLDSNFHHLKNVFKKYQSLDKLLPNEFIEYDKTRIHYLIIAGRREHFSDKTYRLRRKSLNNIKILHYDNLIDVAEFYINDRKRFNDIRIKL